MDAKVSKLLASPWKWAPEPRMDGRVEIVAAFFDEQTGRYKREGVSPQEYLACYDDGLLKFQRENLSRPEGHPSRQEVVDFLEGRLQVAPRKRSTFERPVDPNREVYRDPPAYSMPGQFARHFALAIEKLEIEEQGGAFQSLDNPLYRRAVMPEPKKPAQAEAPRQAVLPARPAQILRPLEQPQPAETVKHRWSKEEKVVALCKAAKYLWEKDGKENHPLAPKRLLDQAIKYLPGHGRSSLHTFFYAKIGGEQRKKILSPHKDLADDG